VLDGMAFPIRVRGTAVVPDLIFARALMSHLSPGAFQSSPKLYKAQYQ